MRGPSKSVAFESPLERDFFILVDFDSSVCYIEEQPVRIRYFVGEKEKSYFPDALVRFATESGKRPVLCEVKTREELWRNWARLRPGFKAARRHARDNGWTFKIFTEREIRGPYLGNIKLLREYRTFPADELLGARIVRYCATQETRTLSDVLEHFSPPGVEKGWLLSQVWHLVAVGRLGTDLSREFDNAMELRSRRAPLSLST